MVIKYKGSTPQIHKTCFVADSADIIGDVSIGEKTTIWFNAVLRGDMAAIHIGKNSNVQDGCVVHCDAGVDTIVGDGVTVGHNAILHSSQIGDNCLIGMGATVLQAKIGDNCIVGAGALVTSGKEIPPNSLVLGSPAKVVRQLTEEEITSIKSNGEHYVELGHDYS